MAKFGKKSLEQLNTCDQRLIDICNEAIKIYDFSVLQGYRGQEQQDYFYYAGQSHLKYPNSKHNKNPSLAVDLAPYPINWKDTKRFYHLAGIIKAIAYSKNINIRWGGDWDNDGDFEDQRFFDLPHFEIID